MSSSYAGKPCPKCGHVRAESASAPDWQCPACRIAYHKFVETRGRPGYADAPGTAGAALDLTAHREVFVTQKFEWAQLFSFETRNRYQVADSAGRPIAYAAEERKGVFGFVLAQFVGHWRTFEIHFYDNLRQPVLNAVHPFRIYFSRLEI